MGYDNQSEKDKLATVGLAVDLPIKGSSILSSSQNMDYAIADIKRYQESHQREVAVSYKLVRGFGVREKYHKLFFKDVAKQRKKDKIDDGYVTLDMLLERKKEIEEGKFKSGGDKIIGLNTCCSSVLI